MAKKRKQEADPSADRAELRRLLEAAKADHHDDGPRLALADWLEEHGGEADRARAEVIRMQLDADGGGVPWRLAVDRIRDRFVHEWAGAGHAEMFRHRLPWCERGLLVAGPGAGLWSTPGGPDEAWQWVETARPSSFKMRDLPTMLASPRMATVPRLEMVQDFKGLPGLRRLLEGVGPGLRSLSFSCFVEQLPFVAQSLPAGLSELSLTAHLYRGETHPAWTDVLRAVSGLESLSLGWVSSPDEAAFGLLANMPRLSRLRLGRLPGTVSLGALAGPGLKVLRVSSLGALADLATLQESACRDELTSLSLGYAGEPGEAVPFRLPRLRRLALSKCGLDGPRLKALAEGGTFVGLSDLALSDNPHLGAGLAALTASLNTGPRRLDLTNCQVGDRGAMRLATWKGLAGVRVLLLGANGLTDKGVRALAESPHAGPLEAISLNDSRKVTAAGIEALLRGPAGARLCWLCLARIADSGPLPVEAFENARPARLRELQVGWITRSRRVQLARLRAALPDCAIG